MKPPVYYPYFDYLRAIAAFGVFVGHADSGRVFPAQLGNACVQVFFALSGFLIGGILLKSKREDLPRFFFNRAVRIWIPYAIAIVILALATAIRQGFTDPKIREFFFYMVTFVYNWFGPQQLAEFKSRMPLDGTANHFWSICVEEQFYLIAPFLVLFLPRPFLLAGLATAAALSPGYFASISAGILLALIGTHTWVLIGCGLIGAALTITGPYIAAAPLVSSAIVGALSRLSGRQTTFGKIVGGASYPFYLNHWIGLFAINPIMKYGVPHSTALAIAFLISACFSLAHFALIDAWIAQNRERFFTPRRGALLCASGFALVAAGLGYAALS